MIAPEGGMHRRPEQGRSTADGESGQFGGRVQRAAELLVLYALCEDTPATMQACMVQTGGARAALSEKLTSHEQACFLESGGCFHQSRLSHCIHRMSDQAAAEALCC